MTTDKSAIRQAMRRRALMKKAGAIGLLSMAGCAGEEDGADTTTEGDDTTTSDGTDTGSDTEKTIRLGAPEKQPVIWDTRKASDTPELNFAVLGTITTWDRQGSVAPHLATDWSFENDGEELVLDLLEGVTFHDGSAFNAEYVKWHMEEFLANGGGTSYIVGGVDEVVVEDSHRARIVFSSPDPYILWDLASGWGQIHSRDAVEEYGDDYGKSGKVVSTGPFKEVEHNDTSAVLEKFEDFDWPDPWHQELYDVSETQPDTVELSVFEEEATRTAALEAGDIDAMVGVPYSKLPDYRDDDSIEIGTPPASTQQMFTMFNLDPETNPDPILANELGLRKGISYGIDREAIVEAVFNGAAAPAPNYLVPTVDAHNLPEEYNYLYDPEKAKQVMRDDGWTINEGGISTKNGKEASFGIITQGDSESRKRASIWKANLKQIGVDVNITQLDFPTFKERVTNGNFAGAMSTYYGWGNADLLWWFNSEEAEDAYYYNANSWKQFPEVTEMAAEAQNASTLEERTSRYKDLHKYLLENVVPNVYEVYPKQVHGWRSYVKNYKPWYKGAPMWPVSNDNW